MCPYGWIVATEFDFSVSESTDVQEAIKTNITRVPLASWNLPSDDLNKNELRFQQRVPRLADVDDTLQRSIRFYGRSMCTWPLA